MFGFNRKSSAPTMETPAPRYVARRFARTFAFLSESVGYIGVEDTETGTEVVGLTDRGPRTVTFGTMELAERYAASLNAVARS